MVFLLTVVALVLLPTAAAQDQVDPLPLIHQRLYDFFLDNGHVEATRRLGMEEGSCSSTCSDTLYYSRTLLRDHTWADINYTDVAPSSWNTSIHIARALMMSRSYRCVSCTVSFKNSTLLAQIQGVLEYWLQKDFRNPNWWWNAFGTPELLEGSALLLGSSLSSADTAKILNIMARANATYTGENFVTSLGIAIVGAVIAQDTAVLQQSFERLWTVVFFSFPPEDGIQVDGSFFQHGPLLQSGSYGGEFLTDLMVYQQLALNTSLVMGPAAVDIFATLVLDGQQYMMRWNGDRASPVSYWDVSVKGRGISRCCNGQLPVDNTDVSSALRTLGGSRAVEFDALADRLLGRGTHFVGSRHYWCADYTAHHTETFFAGLHMHSNRTLPSECMNGENLRGWHLADGATMLYQDGAEYAGIFPVWSWTRIPGTTARQDVEERPCQVALMGLTQFVGGLCLGARCVSAMDFRAPDWGGPGEASTHLTAHKAWFFVEEGMVALGANVTLPLDAPVTTTVDQCLLRAPVFAGTADTAPHEVPSGRHKLAGVDYVSHNNMTYLFRLSGIAPPASVLLQNEVVSGSWYAINNEGPRAAVQKGTLTLEVDHGEKPAGESYAYAVLSGVPVQGTTKAVASFNAKTTILASTVAGHAVKYTAGNESLVLVAAFTAMDVDGGAGWLVHVSQPSFLIVSTEGGSVTFAASSPLPAPTLHFRIDRKLHGGSGGVTCTPDSTAGWTDVVVTLPSAKEMLGSPVIGVCSA